MGLKDALDWYPNGTGNDGKEKGWKGKSRWGVLNKLPIDGKSGREVLVEGVGERREGREDGRG